ncbi:unnamed protein product, partial [Brassica oleracea]
MSLTGELRNQQESKLDHPDCADPVESAARRQRVLEGEVHGLMEKTAASIIEAEQLALQGRLEASFAPGPTTTRKHNLNEGDRELETSATAIPLGTAQPAKQSRKRGRPPAAREMRISPKVFKGSNSRK